MPEQYFRTDTVAEMLGVNYDYIYILRRKAGVKPVHFKGTFGSWYSKEQVELMQQIREKPWLAPGVQIEEVPVR